MGEVIYDNQMDVPRVFKSPDQSGLFLIFSSPDLSRGD
jgi:hypothetical protein